MARKEHHIVPNSKGGWDVKRENAKRSSGHYETNIWQVTDEFSVERNNGKYARPDIVLLVNGIPLVVIECKKSSVDVEEGVKQNVRNWQPDYIPQLFKFTQLAIATKQVFPA